MHPTIAIIAPGAMGSAIARRFTEHDIRVVTLLDGRSETSRRRATEAGMIGVDFRGMTEADVLLSILPPGEAFAVAEELSKIIKESVHKPIFVDCNAIDVSTVRRIGRIVAESGAPFVDGSIIGFPPKPGSIGPRIYLSGKRAEELLVLRQYGLNINIINDVIGSASALKMSFAGINKGLTGLSAAIVLAASRAGSGDALFLELQASLPELLNRLLVTLPDMYPKSYRWVAEMREIAAFSKDNQATARLFEAMGDFFEHMANDYKGLRSDVDVINKFLLLESGANQKPIHGEGDDPSI